MEMFGEYSTRLSLRRFAAAKLQANPSCEVCGDSICQPNGIPPCVPFWAVLGIVALMDTAAQKPEVAARGSSYHNPLFDELAGMFANR